MKSTVSLLSLGSFINFRVVLNCESMNQLWHLISAQGKRAGLPTISEKNWGIDHQKKLETCKKVFWHLPTQYFQ